MTEPEWLTAIDPAPMLHSPGWRPPDRHYPPPPEDPGTCHPSVNDERKLRLYACACYRLSFPQLLYEMDRRAVDLAEQLADGTSSEGELTEVSRKCGATASFLIRQPALRAARDAVGGLPVRTSSAPGPQEFLPNTVRCDILRCVFGNPFRPVDFADSWRSETAVALASGIYADRAFDRLPILADALEEAGCDHPAVLTHCRQPGTHARGCWVVDGVLGKGQTDPVAAPIS